MGYTPWGRKQLDRTEQLHSLTGSSVGKDPPASAGDIRDMGSFPGSGRSPRGGHGNPLQYSCLENPHGQRNLAGYSPWGYKESDGTEVT